MNDTNGQKRFYGKYRGTVFNNIDPLQMGRLQAVVPDVSNLVPGPVQRALAERLAKP